MIDFLENELSIGDDVVFLNHSKTSSSLANGIVIALTERMVRVENDKGIYLRSPDKVVKIDCWGVVCD